MSEQENSEQENQPIAGKRYRICTKEQQATICFTVYMRGEHTIEQMLELVNQHCWFEGYDLDTPRYMEGTVVYMGDPIFLSQRKTSGTRKT